MGEMRTYYYFEACGYVSEPFPATNLDAAIDHVEATFRNPANPDFDGDDGGIVGLDADGDWWDCLTTFMSRDTRYNPENADRLAWAIDRMTGETAPTPGAP